MLALLLACVICFAGGVTSEVDNSNGTNLWAVLVAGSNGFYNYRHQADVCHAYQVLHRHGIPDERIIVMMYDDIAHSEENPIKGKVFNHINGSDVYAGVPKDYTKEEVTPENFLKILLGEKPARGSGKTLQSGPNDHVFVNFVDHGAPGILGFPSDELTAKDLLATLHKMNEMKKYKQMVLYIEACESGSLFEKHKLPNNTNVFATTAANGKESSYACYFDNKIGTYLGDVYSVNWMEDSDKENIEVETLEQQFKRVKRETNTSHVMQYGQLQIAQEPVGEFQGETKTTVITYPTTHYDAVPSRDVPLAIHRMKIRNAKHSSEKLALQKELGMMMKKRTYVRKLFETIVRKVVSSEQSFRRIVNHAHDLTNVDCHHTVVKHFSQKCLPISKNAYTMQFVQLLVNMCEEGIAADHITSGIEETCANVPSAIQNVV